MQTLKKYVNYIMWVVFGFLLTNILVFVGFNVNYKDISLNGNLPNQISVEKAEATNTEGRIYGYVSNNEQNNVNGKYLEIIVYNSKNESIETQYLEINGIKANEQKMFKANFNSDNINSYSINIVEDNNK